MKLFGILTVLFVVIIGVYSECTKVPKCSCPHDVEVEEQVHSNEVLAGAVGALSSAVVSVGGLGLWSILKSRSPSAPDTSSMVSDHDVDDRTRQAKSRAGRDNSAFPPPPYTGSNPDPVSPAPFKTPNIYTAGKNDNVNHRVGTNVARNMMTLNDI